MDRGAERIVIGSEGWQKMQYIHTDLQTGKKITTAKEAEKYLQGMAMDVRSLKPINEFKPACPSCQNVMKQFKMFDFNKGK